MFGLQQIIESPTHTGCRSTSSIVHIRQVSTGLQISHQCVTNANISTVLEKLIESTQGVHKQRF